MPLRCTISQETDEIKLYNAILDITLFTNQARECVDPDVTLRSSFPLTLHSESPLGSSFTGGGGYSFLHISCSVPSQIRPVNRNP